MSLNKVNTGERRRMRNKTRRMKDEEHEMIPLLFLLVQQKMFSQNVVAVN